MRGMLLGAACSFLIYGLLPESIRFSRGITVLGALMATLSLLGVRKIMQWLKVKSVEPDTTANHRVLIVGRGEDEDEVKRLFNQAYIEKNVLGSVSPFPVKDGYQLAGFHQLKGISQVYGISEVIFTQRDLSFKQIIEAIQDCGSHLDYKIHCAGTNSVIGSNSKNTAGDLYTTEFVYRIGTVESKRNKRVVDIVFSVLFILLSPLLIWFVKNKSKYFLHCFLILEGDKTFVGYYDNQFPALKPHLMDVFPYVDEFEIPYDNKEHLNWLYAKNYDAWDDVRIILLKWREL
jgi:O-antigen biosynthesis protein